LEAQNRVRFVWTSRRGVAWIRRPEHSASFLAAIRQLARAMPFSEALLLINCSIVNRLQNPKVGGLNTAGVTTGNLHNARNRVTQEYEITNDKLCKFNLRYREQGILEFDNGSLLKIMAGSNNGIKENDSTKYTRLAAGEEPKSQSKAVPTILRRSTQLVRNKNEKRKNTEAFLIQHPDDNAVTKKFWMTSKMSLSCRR
jgi:hypothetical protein